jgi:hypothetical protein
MEQTQIKQGQLFKERAKEMKFPRIIRVRKVAKMGPEDYVFFMAENQAAQSIHPNGGFIPLTSFLKVWEPTELEESKYSGGNGPA